MHINASRFFAIISFAILHACAQPKYENAPPSPGNLSGQDTAHDKASTCSIKLKSSRTCIKWRWEKQPTSSGMGSFILKLYRGNLYDDSPVLTDLSIQPQVVLWMPSMGHGSTPTSVNRLDVGTYRVSNVFFVMPGEWEIRIQTKDGADIVDEAIISLNI